MGSSPPASLLHLHVQSRLTPTLFPLSPSPCCSTRSFLFPCSSLSLTTGPHHTLLEKKGKLRRNVVVASLFGVGAPEALVIGVVALLVFGPKGLAEVARNLGKTLRAFQPTIRELQDVSREFKSTLEREIGLDEISSPPSTKYNSPTNVNTNQPPVVDPNGKGAYSSEDISEATQELSKSTSTATVEESQDGKGAYTTEDLLKVTEEQLSAAASTETKDTTATEESKVTTDASVPSESSQESPPAATQVEATANPTSEGTPVWWNSVQTQTQTSEKSSE